MTKSLTSALKCCSTESFCSQPHLRAANCTRSLALQSKPLWLQTKALRITNRVSSLHVNATTSLPEACKFKMTRSFRTKCVFLHKTIAGVEHSTQPKKPLTHATSSQGNLTKIVNWTTSAISQDSCPTQSLQMRIKSLKSKTRRASTWNSSQTCACLWESSSSIAIRFQSCTKWCRSWNSSRGMPLYRSGKVRAISRRSYRH